MDADGPFDSGAEGDVGGAQDAIAVLDALLAVVPLLEQRAQQQSVPAVRAVYAGAATRIREVRDAEVQAAFAAAYFARFEVRLIRPAGSAEAVLEAVPANEAATRAMR
jgi:hypothetical protein